MPDSLCLGAILVMAIILISVLKRHTKGRTRSFNREVATAAASPRVRAAADDLFGRIDSMVKLGDQFEMQTFKLDGTLLVRGTLDGVRASAALLTSTLNRAEKGLAGATPTYANYLATHRGLSSTDHTLLTAAKTYLTAGATMREALIAAEPSKMDVPGIELGDTLTSMGHQLQQVTRAVRRLGAALDVE